MKSIRNLLTATLLAAGALLTAASSVSVASAADDTTTPPPPPPGAHGPHGWHHRGGPWHVLRKLNLTAEQKTQVEAIMTAARPQMESLHQQMLTQHAEIRTQVFEVLTPTQQTQLATLEAQMQAHTHGPRGPNAGATAAPEGE